MIITSYAYADAVRIQVTRVSREGAPLEEFLSGVREAVISIPGELKPVPMALLDMSPDQAVELARILLNSAALSRSATEAAPPLKVSLPFSEREP